MQLKNIYQRLNQIVSEVETINPSAMPQGLVKALHKLITKAGVVMIPVVVDLSHTGLRSIVKMEISFVNIDDPSDKIQVQYFGHGIDSQDGGVAKAINHAVNNALLKIFCLETCDNRETQHSESSQTISHEQLETILDLARHNPQKLDWILELLQVRDVAAIPKVNYEEVIASLQRNACSQR